MNKNRGAKLTRWTFLLLAAVAAVLAILSIFQLVIAFQDYRMVDFEAATANDDMKNLKGKILPTCIEGITKKTVEAKANEWDRRTEPYSGKSCMLSNDAAWDKGLALAVQNSAHLFFDALKGKAPSFQSDGTRPEWVDDAFFNTARAAVGSILAANQPTNLALVNLDPTCGTSDVPKTQRYMCKSEGFGLRDSILRPLNHSEAYQALLELAEVTTGGDRYPTPTCYDIYESFRVNDAAELEFDTDYERRVARAAQQTDGFKLPIERIPSACDASPEKAESVYAVQDAWWDAASGNKFATLSSDEINLLYTHCVIQHSYKSSGHGVLDQPEVGLAVDSGFLDPIRAFQFYKDLEDRKHVDGEPEPISHTTYARLYLGQRYGDTVFVYTVLILSGGFVCGIALLVVLVEATRRERFNESRNRDTLGTQLDWLYMKRMQDRYFYTAWWMALVGCVIGLGLWIGKILVMYGGTQRYTRPSCHSDYDGSDSPYKDIFLRVFFDDANRGGWENDVNAHQYELLSVILQFLALLALLVGRELYREGRFLHSIASCLFCGQVDPVRTAVVGFEDAVDSATHAASEDADGEITNSGGAGTNLAVETKQGLVAGDLVQGQTTSPKREAVWYWMPFCNSRFAFAAVVALGAVLIFGGQAFASYWFGVTWARAVLDVDYPASEHVVYAHLIAQSVSLFGTTGALGAIMASIICGFMIRGTGGCAPIVTTIRVVWILYLALFSVVMLGYWNQMYDSMDPEKSKKDCEEVYGGNSEIADNDRVLIDQVDVCTLRWWTYLVGIIILALTFIAVLVWKLMRLCGKKAEGERGVQTELGSTDAAAAQSASRRGKPVVLHGAEGPPPGGTNSVSNGILPAQEPATVVSAAAPFRLHGNALRPDVRVSGYAQHVNGLDNFLRSPQGQAAKPIDIRHVSRR